MLYVTLGISLSFAILLFFLTPATAGHYLGEWLNIGSAWLVNLIEGILRILILIAYVWLISGWKTSNGFSATTAQSTK